MTTNKKNIYSIPAYHLKKFDEKKMVESIDRQVFYKVTTYDNYVEEQPFIKKISTCIDYDNIKLEEQHK